MGRKIVLCFDGTNNKYAAQNTNVVKFYAMLDRNRDDQIAYYQPGIGTFAPPGIWDAAKKWLITRLDLAVAWLLEDHVTDGYRYLMRYYHPGDEIWVFGFSRGAYTARALAGMLFKVGLLSPGNEEMLPFAWDTYKRKREPKFYIGFRHTFSRKVSVRFLGLWDTVSSVGWAWHPEYLQFTANNPAVAAVRHAVALDERRAYFVQNLWTHEPPPGQDVEQVWFPGVHCDVGGGYLEREAGLSKIALEWMVKQAQAHGLRFNAAATAANLPAQDMPNSVTPMAPDSAAPNPAAMKHESLQGLWWVVEYLPKPVKDRAKGYATHWILHRGRRRNLGEGSHIHASVFDRMKLVPSYRPPNLPQKYVAVPRMLTGRAAGQNAAGRNEVEPAVSGTDQGGCHGRE